MRIKKIIGVIIVLGVFRLFNSAYAQQKKNYNVINSTGMDYPSLPLAGWQRNDKPVLKGFLHAYQPCVVETNDREYPYRMWFFGWITDICNTGYPGCDAIYYAKSKNLDDWEVYCKNGSWDKGENNVKWQPVLYSSTNKEKNYYDTWHTGDPSVVLKDGVFYMAFSATSKPFAKPIAGYPSGMMLCVMGATSTDGVNWKKTEQPLLISPSDSIYPPKPKDSRIGDFHRPSLLWDQKNKKWQLYFDYYNAEIKGNFHMGLAENKGDFATGKFNIKNDLNKPLLLGWPNPDVVKIGKSYFSFSDPSGYYANATDKTEDGFVWKDRQLRIAKSNDGLIWEKDYFIPPDPGIDANQIPQAFLCKREGKLWLYLFYSTQVGWRDVKFNYPAFMKDKYNWFYDQIRYIRQEIK